MLTRGVLGRVVEISKSSTHDAHRLSKLLHTSLCSKSVSCSSRHLYNIALLGCRRYATATTTKPTAKVVRDVKKAVAKKPAKRTAATAKKPVAKPKARTKAKSTTKAAPKKKRAAKKASSKKKPITPTRKRKILTPEQKEQTKLKLLKAKALAAPTTLYPLAAWQTFATEALTGQGKANHSGQTQNKVLAAVIADASAKFKNLTPAEVEHYNHLANARNAANQKKYEDWINQHTPDQIRQANNARSQLRRLRAKSGSRLTRRWGPLHDNRQLKRPTTSFIRFVVERRATGDFKSIGLTQSAKLLGEEWKQLSDSEKKRYTDAYNADVETYTREFAQLYKTTSSATPVSTP